MAEVRYEAGATTGLTLAGLQATLRRGSEAQPAQPAPEHAARWPSSVLSCRRPSFRPASTRWSLRPCPRLPHHALRPRPRSCLGPATGWDRVHDESADTAAAPPLADGVVYHVLLDRFLGDEGALPAPSSPGRRAGGTLWGLQRAIEAGYFERLGRDHAVAVAAYQNPAEPSPAATDTATRPTTATGPLSRGRSSPR